MKKFFMPLVLSMFMITTSCTKSDSAKVKADGSLEKVLNIVVGAKVKGFDPNQASDRYSGNEVARIYEGLLQFHYLKRPYELVPNLAESMPEVSSDGLTYTFKIKKGVMFHDNACFPNGKGRELTAEDFVYSIKRMADPREQSKGWWLIDGKIKGLNAWKEKSGKADKTDYSEKLEGIQAIDKYTLKFVLSKPFPQFLYSLAMPFTYAVPKEAVQKYGKEFINNPVGTGPFITGKYTQANKIVYTKNPNYRDEFYPTQGAPGDKERGLLKDAGKKIPLVDKLVVKIMTEEQTRWLNFKKGKLDSMSIPTEEFANVMIPGKGLSDSFKKQGIVERKVVGLDVTYNAFNHEHELFKNNKKLRQAMSSAFDRDSYNKKFYQGVSLAAQSVVPPNIAGHIMNFKGPYQNFNVEQAKKLLSEAGFPDGNGLPEITLHYTYSTKSRQMAEVFQQNMSKIGIKIKPTGVTWPELVKLVNTKQTMMFSMAWGADYPDAENFLQLLYSKNSAPGANGSNYSNPEFDKMFEKAAIMSDSPERTALYEKMYKFAAEEVPWVIGFHRVTYGLIHGWVENSKSIEFDHGMAKYKNINMAKKADLLKKL